jgi:hypothetical protein
MYNESFFGRRIWGHGGHILVDELGLWFGMHKACSGLVMGLCSLQLVMSYIFLCGNACVLARPFHRNLFIGLINTVCVASKTATIACQQIAHSTWSIAYAAVLLSRLVTDGNNPSTAFQPYNHDLVATDSAPG